uniref:Uncharacterized protein n=1 Tax=Rhipicephalus pulchellus TaxID=72859 RepID=L7LXU5_RHIPC
MWKASEWKWWVLFYGAPCLDGILPPNFHKHFCLLVSAIHLLLKDRITREDISDAMGKLSDFVFKMQNLYGEASMTFNVHQLLHLPRSVVELGPLWAHSTFVFESGNGVLLKLISSANGVAVQVLERFIMQLQLTMLKNTLDLQPQVKEMCEQLIAPAPCKIAETRTLGRGIVCGIVDHDQKNAFIAELGFIPDRVTSFQRIVVRGHLLHTSEYKRAQKTRNCTFKCTKGQFYTLHNVYEISDGSCMLMCTQLACKTYGNMSHINICTPKREKLLMPLDRVASISVLMSLGTSCYVADLPNFLEKD